MNGAQSLNGNQMMPNLFSITKNIDALLGSGQQVQYVMSTLQNQIFLSGGDRWYVGMTFFILAVLFQIYTLVNILTRHQTIKTPPNERDMEHKGTKGFWQRGWNLLWRWEEHDMHQMVVWQIVVAQVVWAFAGLFNQGIQLAWTFVFSVTVCMLQYFGYHKNFRPINLLTSWVLVLPVSVLIFLLLPLAMAFSGNKTFNYINMAIAVAEIVVGTILGLVWFQFCIITDFNTVVETYNRQIAQRIEEANIYKSYNKQIPVNESTLVPVIRHCSKTKTVAWKSSQASFSAAMIVILLAV